jgi:hypothetical protein
MSAKQNLFLFHLENIFIDALFVDLFFKKNSAPEKKDAPAWGRGGEEEET